MLSFSFRSLWNRRFLAALTILSIALSVGLILGVERLRTEARNGFANSASGIDLIVAPRGNSVQILMATVFGAGSTGTGLRWDTYQTVSALPRVAWTVPLMLGDNHKGFPVIGTSAAYFKHFRHSGGRSLSFAAGRPFSEDARQEAVVGAEIAERFGYAPGVMIVNAHGAGKVSFDLHDDAPFEIIGVLTRTGTAVDRMIFVPLEGFDALHANRAPPPADPFTETQDGRVSQPAGSHDEQGTHDERVGDAHSPDRINAFYVGLAERTAILAVQRAVNELSIEPVTAVIPLLALTELWSLTGVAERAMQAMALAVAIAGLIGMIVMLSATLETRRREFAILRAVGATPGNVVLLILTEAAVLMAAGIALGVALLAACAALTNPVLQARFGLSVPLWIDLPREGSILMALFVAGVLASFVPAVRVYRMTLADGLSVRL